MRQNIAAVALLLSPILLQSQGPVQPDPPYRVWNASWVTHPTAPLREPLVLHFRRALDLPAAPAAYPVRVSADNRFILFVNGRRVGDGPARGDLIHWRYEQFDLAPYLRTGQNLITATVWNFGLFAPIAQMSDRTAFLLESEADGDTSISTPKGWLVEEEPGQAPLDRSSVNLFEYFASGPGEQIDGAHYDWSWDSPSASGKSWVPVASPMHDSIFPVNRAHSADITGDNPWGLIPDELPHMDYSPTPAGQVVRTDLPDSKGLPDKPATVPAAKHIHILLDRKTLTTGYPELTVSGGKGTKIRLTCSEALYNQKQKKGDRDAVDDRVARGLSDVFLPDGSENRTFEPLWWRTWRYLDLDIQTADEPLQLESLKASFSAYPFEERASFKSGDPDLDKIWEISWRTARLDAHETYMDTPYYEQFQYIGDTRIQALISYTIAGDDRLARHSRHSTHRASLTALHEAATLVPFRKPSLRFLSSISACCVIIGSIDPIAHLSPPCFPALAPCWGGSPTTSSPTVCSKSSPGGVSSTGSHPAPLPPTTLKASPASPRCNISERWKTQPTSNTTWETQSSPAVIKLARNRSALPSTASAGPRSAASSPTILTRKFSASRPISSPSSTTSSPKLDSKPCCAKSSRSNQAPLPMAS